MNIKKTANSLINFAFKRLTEIIGILVFLSGLFLFISLFTYSPDDPNFIFPDNTKIENLFGFEGSFVSDLFFQSLGLISYLIAFSFVITGINIFKNKDFFLLIENTFFVILFSISGSLFFSHFYNDNFTFFINGNGGFVGNYLNETFLANLLQINQTISYYFLIFIISILFLVSINFHPLRFYFLVKKFFTYLKKQNQNYTNKNEIINEYIPQEEIKNLIQEDLPFIKAENKDKNKIKFQLPNIDLLKIPTKKKGKILIKTKVTILNFLKKYY